MCIRDSRTPSPIVEVEPQGSGLYVIIPNPQIIDSMSQSSDVYKRQEIPSRFLHSYYLPVLPEYSHTANSYLQ